MASPTSRITMLNQLDYLEREIASALNAAGQALLELSKEKPTLKSAENNTTTFIKTMEGIENGLMKQINYLTQVSTGQPHEGSSYGAQKDLQMALHRLEHVRSRLNDMERLKLETRNLLPGQPHDDPMT